MKWICILIIKKTDVFENDNNNNHRNREISNLAIIDEDKHIVRSAKESNRK